MLFCFFFIIIAVVVVVAVCVVVAVVVVAVAAVVVVIISRTIVYSNNNKATARRVKNLFIEVIIFYYISLLCLWMVNIEWKRSCGSFFNRPNTCLTVIGWHPCIALSSVAGVFMSNVSQLVQRQVA